MKRLLWILPFLLLAQPAEARRYQAVQLAEFRWCSDCASVSVNAWQGGPTVIPTRAGRTRGRTYSDQTTMLPHPAVCPRRAFCGCGAAIEKFGHNVRELWLAAAWFKFPRSSPGSGMAMVRSHHVAILRSHVGGSLWLVADYNSGGGQSRLHVRDISGWTIVNPS